MFSTITFPDLFLPDSAEIDPAKLHAIKEILVSHDLLARIWVHRDSASNTDSVSLAAGRAMVVSSMLMAHGVSPNTFQVLVDESDSPYQAMVQLVEGESW